MSINLPFPLDSDEILSGTSARRHLVTHRRIFIYYVYKLTIWMMVENFLELSKYFGKFATSSFIVPPHNCLNKVSETFADFKKVFNFKKSLMYVLLAV